VRAVAHYTDGHGMAEQVASAPTTAVGNVNDAPTGAVAVAGTASQGQLLTASNTIADVDGPDPLTITYQWQRQDEDGDWVDIGGATGGTYTLTEDDVGHGVRAVAHYTDGHGMAEQVASAPTTAVGNVNDAPTGAVAVNGVTRVGETLTVLNSIADLDGLDPLTITYQWQHQDENGNWVDISGATGETYTLTPEDLGSEVRAVASYVDLRGTAESVLSSGTSAVQLPAYFVTETESDIDTRVQVSAYSGPVAYLTYEFAGTSNSEAVLGTSWNDFVHVGAGDDAVDGGAGDDVLDGGSGSSFLTGGAGHDIFFVDGRSGEATWSTVTDWEAGEQVSLWGWQQDVSQVVWVDDAGADGYRGVTMHADLDNDGAIDTSVTWAGLSRADLPTPAEHDGLLWFA
jgi:Ca2+-binding RTX toxin-like protein